MKAIKVRLYPTVKQQKVLLDHFNGTRFLYNAALGYKTILYNEYGINKTKFDIIKEIPDFKTEYTFLNNLKAEVLQNVIDNLDAAYNSFFRGGGFPKFKKKSNYQSFTQKQNLKITENRIVFYKQRIKFSCSKRDLLELNDDTKIKRVAYSVNPSRQYFASILIEKEHIKLVSNDNEIGIDLGIKEFMVTSEAEIVHNPRFFRTSIKKLTLLQKLLAKKKLGSNNRNKARIKVAKQHQKIVNQRTHFQQALSTRLIHENQIIYLESLKVANMIKNHKLAKSISDASWSSFVNMLEYKAKWYGCEIVKIGTFEPSSKTCSCCGWKNDSLTLADRIFKCQECDLEIDRDYNAALNILKIGRNYPKLTLEETKSLDRQRIKKITDKVFLYQKL